MAKIFLASIIIGVVSYLIFAALVLILIPSLLPYPLSHDELLLKLTWSKRLLTEKLCNLGVITFTGLIVGLFYSYTEKRLLLFATLTALIYQLSGITYLILRWGTAYYGENHRMFQTLLDSIVFCIIFAFIGQWSKQFIQFISAKIKRAN